MPHLLAQPYRCHIWGFKGKGVLIRLECYFDAPGTNPMCRDIELENRHSLCLEVMKILERNNCRLGAYDMSLALPGAMPGGDEMSLGFNSAGQPAQADSVCAHNATHSPNFRPCHPSAISAYHR